MLKRSVNPLRPSHHVFSVALSLALAAPAAASPQGPAVPADVNLSASMTAGGVSIVPANRPPLGTIIGSLPLQEAAPRPFTRWSISAQELRDSILVSVARTTVGTRYLRGGQSVEHGFDCSGLVRYIMTALDVRLPRTAAAQAASGSAVGRDTTRLRPGDLLTFGGSARGASHVGIYIGNGRFVHASSVAGRVIESDLRRPPSQRTKPWRDSRRVLSGAGADASARSDG